MRRVIRIPAVALAVSLALGAHICRAQDADAAPEPEAGEAEAQPQLPPPEPPPPIYEDQLLRLAEILGSLSFLRPLCGESDGPAWQAEMRALIAAENPGPQRLGRLVGRFNHGYETFNAVYRSCTPSARLAIERYVAEGSRLSSDVRSRYGQ
jgi:uncharacterized protein (TIGR02301 family)